MKITEPFAPASARDSVVRPSYLSHGTLECHSLQRSRLFFEEFLGLECVRHARSAMAIRCGLKFHIVCLQVGSALQPVTVDSHWGIDVESQADVDRIWHAAHALKERYGIRQVLDLVKQHGVYSFYMEDLDSNWWEIQYYDGVQHDDMFDFGDRFEDEPQDATAST
jgi:catechol 2,3-dioxygenase-like lactoylglutathione lyase family enzyme